MYTWFYNPVSHFHFLGIAHILTICIIFATTIALYVFRKALIPYRKFIRLTIGWALIICHLSLDLWYFVTDTWSLTESLPFQLCSIASILCGVMLIIKNQSLFEILYFIALGGAIQAILTPDLGFGFPQFRYLQFFLLHFLIFISPLILCWLYGYRITFKSLLKSFVALNVIAVIMYFVDLFISANYMFLVHKPVSTSLLDFLGPYPYYILSLEGVGLVIYIILYLPFAFGSKTKRKHID
jgi:hypothetical integral membrane protein (TIGR02206 family)